MVISHKKPLFIPSSGPVKAIRGERPRCDTKSNFNLIKWTV